MSSRSRATFRVGLLLMLTGLVVVIGGLRLCTRPRDGATSDPVSLAVLPFTADGSDAASSYLAAGLGLDLLERLQGVRGLQCIPRDALFAPRAADESTRQLARRLGAEILILGSVSAQTGKLEISLEMLDAANDRVVATAELAEGQDRVLELQKRMVHLIVAELQLRLTSGDTRRLDRDSTRSLKAWTAFAQGVETLGDLVNPRSPEFAAELFGQATRLDPNFAQARAHLSLALWRRNMNRRDPTDLRQAASHADRALAQRPDLDVAVSAWTLIDQSRNERSGDELSELPDTARVAKPDQVWRALAASWLQVGELELAESAWLAAMASAPAIWLNPYGYGQFLLRSGRLAESAQAFQTAADVAPATNTWPVENVLSIHLATGDLSAAIALFESLETPLTDSDVLRQVATAYAILDRLEPAERLYRKALELGTVNPKVSLELADVLYRGGRTDEADAFFLQALSQLRIDNEGQTDTARQSLRALLLAKTDNCREAQPLATTLMRHQAQSAEVWLDLAKVFTLCGDQDLALEALAIAVGRGISPELLASRYEFHELEEDARFVRLLEGDDAVPPSP